MHINIGTYCGDMIDCDKYKKCKYKSNYLFHNMSVRIHSFFQYKLHIKLPHLIYIGKKWERLSGTNKCPYNKSRNYGCYDCKYLTGSLCDKCCCKARINTKYEDLLPDINIPDWGRRCAYFEKNEWADDYKKQ